MILIEWRTTIIPTGAVDTVGTADTCRRPTAKTVLLHRPCLNNLLEISNHEVFRHAVQSLTIGVNSLRPEPMVPKEWRLWAFNVTGYIRAWVDQQHMASGLNTHYLSEALSNFPNLKDVTVSQIDFDNCGTFH